ncbi:MAG: hypothetical protein WD063_18360 [Pirellulales bacterium]
MKHVILAASLALLFALAGCSRGDGDPIGAGVGDSGISGGTGGTGSGPTGTGGGVPGENPAGDDIHSNGTGTDAPE